MIFQLTAVVAAKDIMVGDYLYNSLSGHSEFSAVRVRTVTQMADQVTIETSTWSTVKHPCEGLAIMRVTGPEGQV